MSACMFCGKGVAIPAMGWKGEAGMGLCGDCAKQLEQVLGLTLDRPDSPEPEPLVPDAGEAPAGGPPISCYARVKFTEDGRVIGVLPLLMGQGQIVMGRADRYAYTDEWMYGDLALAIDAYLAWDGAAGTEPVGWLRHINDGSPTRRRTYADDGTLLSEEERA